MAQLNEDQLNQAMQELQAFCGKIVGCDSSSAIDFFASNAPTRAEQDGCIAIMNKYITPPEAAHIKIDSNN